MRSARCMRNHHGSAGLQKLISIVARDHLNRLRPREVPKGLYAGLMCLGLRRVEGVGISA
eukprot:10385606-Heterocapsa_arctica.AAC.1